ncbi:MAG: redoxin domain-containing protein [Kiritimatiellae bacterium]|nr:redoxin domain-containing protein [Kiritimatiellia bacterium]
MMTMNPLNALLWVFLAGGAASGPAGSAVEPSGFHLQAGRFGMPAASLRGFVFVAGGCSDDGLCDDIEGMDPRTGVVLSMAPSVLPRYFHGGAAYNDRFILVGGVPEEGGVTGEVEEFTPDGEGSVRRLPPLPVPVSRAGVAVHGDRLYVVGGETGDRTRTAKVQIFDFKSGTWSAGADLPVPREGLVLEKDGRLYAPGGYDGVKAITDFQVYDIAADRWERLTDLPIKMSAHSGVIVGDTLYTFGDYEVLNRTAACDLKTGEWSLIEAGYRSSRHNAAVVHSNEVLVIGGNLSPSGPFVNGIQRFPVDALAAAPRRPWTAENEPKPERAPAPAVRDREEAEAAPAPVSAPKGPEPSGFELSGKPAPDFELELLDGSAFRLADHKDKIVVLDFWATWCPPCLKALPHMAALATDYEGKDVVFLGVSRDRPGDKDKIAPLLAEHKVPYPTGLDLQGLGLDYSVAGIPCVVLIGRDGRVQGRQVGFWDEGPAELRRAIDQLLAGETLPSAKPPPKAAVPKEERSPRAAIRRRAMESVEPDERFFTLKWRREIERPSREVSSRTRLDLHVPPDRLVVASDDTLHVLKASDGEILRTIPLPEAAVEPDEMDRRPFLVYLQDGTHSVVAAVRTKYEVTETGPSSRSFRTVRTDVFGFTESGGTIWTNTLDESSSVMQVLAIPVAADRDYLLVAGWNQFLLIDPKGEIKLDQAVGFQDQWTIRPGADGKLAVVIRGDDVAAYEWNPLAGD